VSLPSLAMSVTVRAHRQYHRHSAEVCWHLPALLQRDKQTEERGHLHVELGLRAHKIGPTQQKDMQKRVAWINKEIDRLNAVIRESGGVLDDA
jgi:hypothetical protein